MTVGIVLPKPIYVINNTTIIFTSTIGVIVKNTGSGIPFDTNISLIGPQNRSISPVTIVIQVTENTVAKGFHILLKQSFWLPCVGVLDTVVFKSDRFIADLHPICSS